MKRKPFYYSKKYAELDDEAMFELDRELRDKGSLRIVSGFYRLNGRDYGPMWAMILMRRDLDAEHGLSLCELEGGELSIAE